MTVTITIIIIIVVNSSRDNTGRTCSDFSRSTRNIYIFNIDIFTILHFIAVIVTIEVVTVIVTIVTIEVVTVIITIEVITGKSGSGVDKKSEVR